MAEKNVIKKYLPEQMSDAELISLVDETISSTGATNMQHMGQVVGVVKSRAGPSADGSKIAQLVKERLQ